MPFQRNVPRAPPSGRWTKALSAPTSPALPAIARAFGSGGGSVSGSRAAEPGSHESSFREHRLGVWTREPIVRRDQRPLRHKVAAADDRRHRRQHAHLARQAIGQPDKITIRKLRPRIGSRMRRSSSIPLRIACSEGGAHLTRQNAGDPARLQLHDGEIRPAIMADENKSRQRRMKHLSVQQRRLQLIVRDRTRAPSAWIVEEMGVQSYSRCT